MEGGPPRPIRESRAAQSRRGTRSCGGSQAPSKTPRLLVPCCGCRVVVALLDCATRLVSFSVPTPDSTCS